jgi:hypothetical protein
MTHLSRDELLGLAESDAPIAAGHHAASCPACRQEVESLRTVLHDARSVEVPEPSPLFWEHLSARVHRAIAEEPVAASADAGPWFRPRWALALGGLSAVVLAGVLVAGRGPSRSPAVVPQVVVAENGPSTIESTPVSEVADGMDGEDWDLVTGLAEDADVDDVSDLLDVVTPGTADGVVPRLSDEEQDELIRLIRAEMGKGRPS